MLWSTCSRETSPFIGHLSFVSASRDAAGALVASGMTVGIGVAVWAGEALGCVTSSSVCTFSPCAPASERSCSSYPGGGVTSGVDVRVYTAVPAMTATHSASMQ